MRRRNNGEWRTRDNEVLQYLYTLVARNHETGKGAPLCFMITNSLDSQPITSWLVWLVSLGFKPRTFMIDNCDTEIAAIRLAFGDQIRINICHWHILRAWRKQSIEKIKVLHGPQAVRLSPLAIASHRKAGVDRLVAMMKACDEDEFNWAYDELYLWIEENSHQWDAAEFLVYFDNHYLPKKKEWSNAFREVKKK